MNEVILGAYWRNRPLTLRQYVDSVRGFLVLLRETHPAFASLEWVGDRPNSAVEVSPDLGNLDEILLRHSWDKRDMKGKLNADGTPEWSATNQIGFRITFATTGQPETGEITISVRAGLLSSVVPDSVVINFLGRKGAEAPLEFTGYEFLKELFGRIIQYWNPDEGLVTSREFAERVCPDGPSKAGWLTYVKDPRAGELTRLFPTESLGTPGIVFTLGRQAVSPQNVEQLATALRLKEALKEIKTGRLAGA